MVRIMLIAIFCLLPSPIGAAMTAASAIQSSNETNRGMRTCIVIDDTDSGSVQQISGTWGSSATIPGFYGSGYLWSNSDMAGVIAYTVPAAGTFDVTVGYTSYNNRASNVQIYVNSEGSVISRQIDQRSSGNGNLGIFTFGAGDTVVISTSGADAAVVADAVTFCPTTAPAPSPGASATGDPHLQNVFGERFDLMAPGDHVLINIPRGERAENVLLRVQATARRLGGQCEEIYFQKLNVTGAWAELKKARGYQYNVAHDEVETPAWVAFGKVELKVTRGHTNSGILYLNVYVRHLGRAGFAIGGLLGEDDHSDVSEPAAACTKHLSLEKSARQHMSASFSASTAEGSFA